MENMEINLVTETMENGYSPMAKIPEASSNENMNGNKTQCAFRMVKPKMPKFLGDSREYMIFKSDFKHLVETRYSKRDAITLLRESPQGKPLELIKGIGQDYDAAWDYLDSVYGDRLFVADTITQDITRFKPLRDGEDASVAKQREAILPIVTLEILGSQGGTIRGNVLLDSGGQVNLIRLSLAEELRLKGKDIDITIAKVGGEEEEMTTKLFRFCLRSLESRATFTVMAVGIPSISAAYAKSSSKTSPVHLV